MLQVKLDEGAGAHTHGIAPRPCAYRAFSSFYPLLDPEGDGWATCAVLEWPTISHGVISSNFAFTELTLVNLSQLVRT